MVAAGRLEEIPSEDEPRFRVVRDGTAAAPRLPASESSETGKVGVRDDGACGRRPGQTQSAAPEQLNLPFPLLPTDVGNLPVFGVAVRARPQAHDDR